MLTVGIKTFCRPNALRETLNNITKIKNLNFTLLIADDSSVKYKWENKRIIQDLDDDNTDIRILDLEFDSGLSKGRNAIVKNTKTKYLMILDDSRYFTNDLPISKMVRFLEETKYSLIFGKIENRPCGGFHYTCLFDKIEKNRVVCRKLRKINTDNFKEIYETNLGLNAFIAETDTLKKTLWREEFKLGEHELFFIDYYKKGYKCAFSPEICFREVNKKNKIYEGDFQKYRNRITMKNIIEINFYNKT